MNDAHKSGTTASRRRGLSRRPPKRALQALMVASLGSALGWAWSALPPTLARGPYLQATTATGITVVFKTSTAATSVLRAGPRPGAPWELEMSRPSATTHVYQLAGLRPETRYYYEIVSEGAVLAGGAEHSFHTAPPDNSRAPLRFVAWGDSGTGSSAQLAVAARIEEVVPPPQFALGLGDLVYEDGEWENYDPFLFRPYERLFARATFWPTLGNHDVRTENGAPYFDAFYLPTTTGRPGNPSNTEKYYSFDHGMAHFVCADSESTDHNPGSTMYRWLSDDLDHARARGKRWLIAFMHHPPYSAGTHESESESDLVSVRENLVPLFESKGVDMVLVGHSHVYERSFLARHDAVLQNDPSDYTKIASPDGTLYLVSGCGGKTGSGPLDHPLMAVSRGGVAGFNVIDLSWRELRGSFVERDGRTTDLFTLHKAADTLPPRVAEIRATSETEIEVVFDEPVRAGSAASSAENVARYDLAGGAVVAANLASDRRTVTLATTGMLADRCALLFVQGVADESGNADSAGQRTYFVPGGAAGPGGSGAGDVAVAQGATWRYQRGVAAPPATWRAPGFDDSGWTQGPAGFGYADEDDATVLADMRDAYASVYLRTRFSVAAPADVTGMLLNVNYDDGFVAFLNGVEVARAHVPAGQTHTSFASPTHEAGAFETFDLAAFRQHLVPGVNVLAVEGHNAELGSSDFSLHPELVLAGSSSGGTGSRPVAILDGEVRTANSPAQVEFTSAYSSDPDGRHVRALWDFGDGTQGFGKTVTHLYDRPGIYTVTLLVRDRQFLEAIDRRDVRIHTLGNAPVAQLFASSTRITRGGRIDLDSLGSVDPDGGPLTVHWDFGAPGDGPTNESAQTSLSRVFPVPGSYRVTLAVTDDEGSTGTQNVVITVD